jgi:hypothetical protein
MGALDLVFDWPVFGFGAPILIGVACFLVSDEVKAFKGAKACFYTAAAWVWGKVLMWAVLSNDSFRLRALVTFVVCGLVGVGLVEAIRVATKRQDIVSKAASSERTNDTGPDLSSIANDVATIKKNTTPIPDRHLTVQQIQYLQATLKEYRTQPLRVSFLIGDVESQNYAQEFASVLGSPPLKWEAGMGLPFQFDFSGVGVAVQDPTDVPPAAEALAASLEALGISVLRIPQSNMVSIDGNKASPIFHLWISKKGETTRPPRKKLPLHVPDVNSGKPVASMSDGDLEVVALDLAEAMRVFEARNKEQFANEWHVAGRPLEKGSYRLVFEAYRKRAIDVRAELWKRLNSQPATTFALDADFLGGAAPITDAANYLGELSKRLRDSTSHR